jgi:hypothetical protein
MPTPPKPVSSGRRASRPPTSRRCCKCPPGFVDSVERAVDSFDEDVKAVIAAAEQSRDGETTVRASK